MISKPLSPASFLQRIAFFLLFFFALPCLHGQAQWKAVGPWGGDARTLAAVPGQPRHLYLGTTNGWLYESVDGGTSWQRLAKIDGADDLILDHIVVDRANPGTIFVAAWTLNHPGGGLWVSRDGGHRWSELAGLKGQSIRAFAQAPSKPEMLYAGTLTGVFRSTDSGLTWKQISPPDSQEIHEVESLAIDPVNPEVIYAGTWHLPWKTVDGGKSWRNIKQGIIDDSDVFSIIIDPEHPKIVFASACSGIYKSENAAELFKKIAGIPATARRTRVLKQDPANSEVVYAGTTEGLYKTVDGGRHFQRMTGPEVIVNDVFVDPTDSERVLLATDRGGVLTSEDGAENFTAANTGFSGRKVEALLVDSANPARIFAGIVNDKSFGGAFVSTNGGRDWKQLSDGLDGLDVFALAQSPEGLMLAGTNHGIFTLQAGSADAPAQRWTPSGAVENTLTKTFTESHSGVRVNVEKPIKDTTRPIVGRVHALDLSGDAWLASTTEGLFTSKDKGASWQGGPVMGSGNYLSIAVQGARMAAARADGVVLSTDAGASWMPMGVPQMLTRIHSITFSADGTLWIGAREGVYFSHDAGKTWLWVHRLPLTDVDELFYDAGLGKILVSSRASDQIYLIDPKSLAWRFSQTGFRINRVRVAGGKLLAASLFDGVAVEEQGPGNGE
jgi:photosystem II stability/assembly factor-like uncharacterized protein